MRISLKLNIIFVCIVAFPMVFVGGLIYNNARANFILEIRNKLELIALLEAEKISKSILDLKTDLQIMQQYYNIKFNLPQLVADGNKRKTKKYNQAKKMLDDQLMAWLISDDEIADLMLVAPNGKIVYSLKQIHKTKEFGKTLSDPGNTAFEQGKKGIYITDVFKNEEANEFRIIGTAPVHDFEGNFTGVIALEMDLTAMYKQLGDRLDLGVTGETYLINKDKLMISPSRFIENAILNVKVDTENSRLCFLNANKGEQNKGMDEMLPEQELLIFPDYRGVEVLGMHAYIPELQWGLLVEIDASEAFTPINNLRTLSIIITLIVLLLVFIVSYSIAQAISQPIKQLHKGTEIIGKGDLSHKVGTESKDEIGQLSRAFDEMVLSLKQVTENLKTEIVGHKKTEKDLQKYRQHLEELVEERTRDLEEANKEMEAFSYSVSHDLRAPLRHIGGFTSLLDKNIKNKIDEKSQNYINNIISSSKQMNKLIDDLLVFSRMGRKNVNKTKINMKTVVDEAIELFESDIKENNISIIIDDMPEVNIDTSLMEQVWINLISNAIKFTGSKKRPKIHIGIDKDSDANTIFFIKDNGVGFDQKYVGKIFGVFQRLHTIDEFPGTGIGLANVKRIILKHGGDIRAEGKINKGASFFFRFPDA